MSIPHAVRFQVYYREGSFLVDADKFHIVLTTRRLRKAEVIAQLTLENRFEEDNMAYERIIFPYIEEHERLTYVEVDTEDQYALILEDAIANDEVPVFGIVYAKPTVKG